MAVVVPQEVTGDTGPPGAAVLLMLLPLLQEVRRQGWSEAEEADRVFFEQVRLPEAARRHAHHR